MNRHIKYVARIVEKMMKDEFNRIEDVIIYMPEKPLPPPPPPPPKPERDVK